MKNNLKNIKIKDYIAYIGIVVVFAILTKGRILAWSNLQLLLSQSLTLIIVCIGATFCIAAGNIDFSLGAVVGLAACCGAVAGKSNTLFLIPVCILVAVLLELLLAAIHIQLKVPAFIASWAMMFFAQGIQYVFSGKYQMGFPSELKWINSIGVFLAILLVVYVIAYILFEYTGVGKYNKAIGSNIVSAEVCGIPVKKYKYIGYLISGICAGIVAVLTMSRAGSADQNTGSGMAINVLIACVLGGIALNGGTNTKLRAGLIGAFLLIALQNGMTISGISNEWIGAVKGIVFLVAVFASYDRTATDIIQ